MGPGCVQTLVTDQGGSGRTYSGVWAAGQVVGKPFVVGPIAAASGRNQRNFRERPQRFLKPPAVGTAAQERPEWPE